MAALQPGLVGGAIRGAGLSGPGTSRRHRPRFLVATVVVLETCAPAPPAAAAEAAPNSAPQKIFVAPTGSDESGTGSRDAPYRSILTASRSARPGTIVNVLPGEYEGGFQTTASGMPGAPIRYVSEQKWAARIVSPRKATRDIAWDNRGAHVVIDGFEVDGSNGRSGKSWRLGIYSTGSNSLIIRNHVHDIAKSSGCDGRGGAGVEGDSYFGGADIDLVANVVHDIGSQRCKFVQGVYQTARGTVVNNVAYRISGWGIHLWHDVQDVIVANNTVVMNGRGGILVGGGDYIWTRGPADGITVANNIVVGNRGPGIQESGHTGDRNLFTHNLAYRNAPDWRLVTSAPDQAAIRADPRFVVADAVNPVEYRLGSGSPALGVCNPAFAPPLDIENVPRSGHAGCDLGAYQRTVAR